MDIFFWLIFGGIAGFFSFLLLPKKLGTKVIGDILGGAVGGVVGRILVTPFSRGFTPTTLIFCLLGIIVGIGIARSLRL